MFLLSYAVYFAEVEKNLIERSKHIETDTKRVDEESAMPTKMKNMQWQLLVGSNGDENIAPALLNSQNSNHIHDMTGHQNPKQSPCVAFLEPSIQGDISHMELKKAKTV